jgi:hypothetical protein
MKQVDRGRWRKLTKAAVILKGGIAAIPYKVFNLIGVALLLSAWLLEWHSVRHWDLLVEELLYIRRQAHASFASFETEKAMLAMSHVPAAEHLPLMEVRARSWRSASYRGSWASIMANQAIELRIVDDSARAASRTWNLVEETRFHNSHRRAMSALDRLAPGISATKLRAMRNPIRGILVDATPAQSVSHVSLIPDSIDIDPERVTFVDARYIETMLEDAELAAVVNIELAIEAVRHRAESRTTLYQLVFLLGSLFIVAAGAKEIRAERPRPLPAADASDGC